MSFDFNEFEGECALDNVIKTQARIHKTPIEKYHIDEYFKREICKDCSDNSCYMKKSEKNAKGEPS